VSTSLATNSNNWIRHLLNHSLRRCGRALGGGAPMRSTGVGRISPSLSESLKGNGVESQVFREFKKESNRVKISEKFSRSPGFVLQQEKIKERRG